MRRSAQTGTSPRVAALYATRSWLLLLLLTVAWMLAALLGGAQFSRLSLMEKACLLLGALCVATAWIFRNRTWALVLLVCAPALLVVAAWSSPPAATVGWIAVSSSVSQVAFGFVLLGNQWIGLAGIAGSVTILAEVWSRRPANVLPGSLVIANGWIGLVAIAASALALWLAWRRLLRQARIVDRRLAEWEGISDSAREQQERARLWREAVAQVHETLLTTIRYVLQTAEVDPSGLVHLRSHQQTSTRAQTDWQESVARATAARIGAGIVEMDESLADLPIDSTMREPIRAAVFEGVSNAVRHGGASRVTVTGGVDTDGIWIRIQDNGSGPRADAQPGLGWSEVLNRQLGAISGSWTITHDHEGTVLTLRIPLSSSPDRFLGIDDGFEQGRILMTWPLLALAFVSVLYSNYLPLGVIASLATGILLASGIALGILAIISSRDLARRGRPFIALSVALIPLLLLFLERADEARMTDATIAQIAAIAALLQAAGYTVIALGLWARVHIAVLALVIWGSGAVLVAMGVPQPLRTPVFVALANCLIVMPLVVGVSRIGTRRFAIAQRIVEQERSRIVLEAARAEVARSINASLESCVGETNAIIDEVAACGRVSPDQRSRLAMLDGLIRATIQVDPVLSGGFAQAGSELVVRGFQTGASFDVRVIEASQDMRSLDRELLDQLSELVTTTDAEGRIQVFHDELEDFLVLTLRWSSPARVPTEILDGLSARFVAPTVPESSSLKISIDLEPTTDLRVPSIGLTEVTVTISRHSQTEISVE